MTNKFFSLGNKNYVELYDTYSNDYNSEMYELYLFAGG